MNLYITDTPVDPMTGTAISPSLMCRTASHLVIASVMWAEAWVDVAECIPEGTLTHLHEKCGKVYARVPEHPSRHQMILLCELYPELAGTIRKTFLKGESIHGVLPAVWGPGDTPGRDPLHLPNA